MLCAISGEFRTPNGQLHPGAVVKFRRSAKVHAFIGANGPVTIVPDEVTMTVGANGMGTVTLYPGRYQVELFGSNGQEYTFRVNVPTETSILFSALLEQAADYGDGGQLDTIAALAAQAFQSRNIAQTASTYIQGLEDEILAAGAAGLTVPPLATQVGLDAATASAAATTATTKATEANASAGVATTARNEAVSSRDQVLAIEAMLPRWKGAWISGMAYVFGDLVRSNGSSYFCVTPHTAGTFNTDLAALRWEPFALKGDPGAGTGDVLASNAGSEYTANQALFRSNVGLTIGTNVQAFNQLLQSVSALATNGFMVRVSGSGAVARSIVGTANQISVNNGDGVSGNPTLSLVLATQAEAEQGVDNNKPMTSLRVAQSISARGYKVRDTKPGTGSSQIFADIPAGVNELHLMCDFISFSGGASLLVRAGTSGGISTINYANILGNFFNGAHPGITTRSDGISVGGTNTAGGFYVGVVTIRRVYPGGSVWMANWQGYRTEDGTHQAGFSRLDLFGELTQIQVLPSTGTLDNGTFTLAYELP